MFLVLLSLFTIVIIYFRYDENDEEHNKVKRGVEKAQGIHNIETAPVILDAIRKAGFEII